MYQNIEKGMFERTLRLYTRFLSLCVEASCSVGSGLNSGPWTNFKIAIGISLTDGGKAMLVRPSRLRSSPGIGSSEQG